MGNLPDMLAALLGPLHFLRPGWLAGLLALPLLAWQWRRRRDRQSVWHGVVDAHLLPHLLHAGGPRTWGAPAMAGLGLVLALVALAGPTWRQGEQPLLQDQAPLVIALDLSGAMLANDLPPSRLLQARASVAQLLSARAGAPVGLVAFADDAYTVAPLTDDAANVALFLDALAPDLMPQDGSRASRAIEQAARLLRQAGFAAGDIVLLTDHADAAAMSAATAAARAGFRVSTLGVGTRQGSFYRRGDGTMVQARLDEGSLRDLARAGGGRYAPLGTQGAIAALALGMGPAALAPRAGTRSVSTRMWRDEGYWLLLPLMLVAALAFRRGAVLGALVVCLALPALPVRAAPAADDGGQWWRRSDQADHAQLVRGSQAYRKGDFAAAEQAWRGIGGADAAYNRGNALARAGRYADAIAAYDQALRLTPGMPDALANRQAVLAAMARKPPPGPRQDPRSPSGGGKGQPQPEPGQPRSGEASGTGDSPRPPSSPSAGQPAADQAGADAAQPSSPAPADGQAQQRADQAQRARMRQAVGEGVRQVEDGRPAAGTPERAETAAEREKRLANEAWLRRIPDDPGGLLRAKFRLEHERRMQEGATR